LFKSACILPSGGKTHLILFRAAWIILICLGASFPGFAQKSEPVGTAGTILTVAKVVEIKRNGGSQWSTASTNQVLTFGDMLRTGPESRATVRLSDLSILRINENTTLELRKPVTGNSLIDLKSGSSYFFNRSKPSSVQFQTPLVSGAIRGTEFNLSSADNGTTVLTLLEGEVVMNNRQGELTLRSGEQGIVDPGQAPRKTAVIEAINIIQWNLYYPAVLDPKELHFTSEELSALADSLASYRTGDLLAALSQYPANRIPSSDAERAYRAELLLSVGQVDQAEEQLKQLQLNSPSAKALLMVIAAVKHQNLKQDVTASTASEWLGESYYEQSQSRLKEALNAARQSTQKSPDFGFAWVRVAELEFALGHLDRAKEALDRGIQLSPRNAQAFSLKGYMLAAENKSQEATVYFGKAIAIDGALANAWLGRGLAKIREGKIKEGREDIMVAAALEPNRSELRSYLAKAWDETHDKKHAEKELKLAAQLDPQDPTPWLYSALIAHQYNRDNEAIADLEKSKELNDNRSVYRSRFLLDQDKAVRSANLAKLYRDVGMFDVSVREAARAVDYDYANYSSHLFLANSYDALRDPKQVNLRYETPWLSQLLVADLLAPVGSIPLSQNTAQQDYNRLFSGNHVGAYNDTTYFSRGDWLQNASVYGNSGNTAFAVDAYYLSQNGWRTNNDVRNLSLDAKLKQQLTPADSVFLDVVYNNYKSGDVLQYFDQRSASPTLRVKEKQDPNLFAGYHHEWSPGIHTLFLAGRLQDEFSLQNPSANVFVTTKNFSTGQIVGVAQRPALLDYTSDLVAYTAELQQIFQTESQLLVAGGRFQTGDIDTRSFIQRNKTVGQTISPDLTRASVYGYYSYNIFDPLLLTVGLSYDHLEFPQNNELPPVSDVQSHKDKVSPKVGFRWTPLTNTTFRGIWSRSLGGVFYDTSVRLEPTEIAGFNQAFRSIIPESVAGLVPGSEFETFGLAFDQKFQTRTYFSVMAELLKSRGSRTVGTLDAFGPLLLDIPSGVNQTLDYQEKSLYFTLNQLLCDEIAVGSTYRISVAELEDRVPAMPAALSGNFSLSANRDVTAILHQINLYALYNYRSGVYAKAEAVWSGQSNQGYAVDLPGDDFWQFNAFLGYRFPRRLAEFQLGLLNITDRDYRLNPLNLYSELPRGRTLAATLRFNF
jgi:Flp pilus assembly protein TadD